MVAVGKRLTSTSIKNKREIRTYYIPSFAVCPISSADYSGDRYRVKDNRLILIHKEEVTSDNCKVTYSDLIGGTMRITQVLAQQYSGPVMAKGLEDTAFYRYNRFIALNEVGGYPEQFRVSISAFHKENAKRAKRWPDSMLSTSTHDTKRGEDTRARLAVLSEIPDEWAKQVQAWSRLLRVRRGDIEAAAPPDRNDEYLLYQLVVGTWPAELTGSDELDPSALESYAVRLKGAMTKSMREAKVRSTWTSPNAAYEEAVLEFVDGALNLDQSRAFLTKFLPFQERVARLGVQNSLVQTALKLTSPGVPDIYQGADLWDLSLVDPDNRRPVDYGERIRLLDQVDSVCEPARVKQLLHAWQDGAAKLFVISRLLKLRAAKPELFARGTYEPLAAVGPKSDQVCAFARVSESDTVVVATSRFPARLEADPDWAGTVIPLPANLHSAGLRDVLGEREIGPADQLDTELAFRDLPAAVFVEIE